MHEKLNTKKLIIFLTLFLILGIALVLYPLAASHYSFVHQSSVEFKYNEELKTKTDLDFSKAKQVAQEYNNALLDGTINGLSPESTNYNEILNLTHNGIMGIVQIPAINVSLPIYHGTSDRAIKLGAGHMSNTSLPIGGIDSHCVLSAHSGMASSRGFTDIVNLKVGDHFYLDVLDEELEYEITEIQTVLPYEIDYIKIVKGKDLVSLVTCVPYGINTHRLIVTGSRIESPVTEDNASQKNSSPTEPVNPYTPDEPYSEWYSQYISGIIKGITLVLLVILIILSCKFGLDYSRRRKP